VSSRTSALRFSLETLAVLGIAAVSACGRIATQPSPQLVVPRLPVTVEGVVFNAPQFSRWTSSEQRRVGYRNVQFIRPTHVVLKGRQVHVLPQAPMLMDLSDFTYTYEGRERTFDDYVKQMQVAGVLVLHNGQIVLERYAAGHGPASAWTSFSVAKSVVSLLVGAAVADGAIRSLDDSVTHYVRALRGSAYDDVTIRQLLQMSSGVAWNENYDDPASDVSRFPGGFGIDTLLANMSRLPRRGPPGSVFNYNSGEIEIVGEVVRSATGRSLAQYLSEKIWSPAGMEADAYWVTFRQHDVELADCCLSATLRDYGRLGLLALRDGIAPNGKRLLPRRWMAEATSPSATNPEYGYLWWLLSPPGRYAAIGIHGQQIYVDPANNVVVVIQSFWDSATGTALSAHRKAFRDALTREVVGHASAPLRSLHLRQPANER
jgi:CubicO group peptidase (beta-lactamase class C family)